MIDILPVELIGSDVLGYLSLKDMVMLERSCGSKKFHQLFLTWIPFSPPVVLSSFKHNNKLVLDWFAKLYCRIKSLFVWVPWVPGESPVLPVQNLQVEYYDLHVCGSRS